MYMDPEMDSYLNEPEIIVGMENIWMPEYWGPTFTLHPDYQRTKSTFNT